MKNKYYNRSRISEAKFREVVKYFSFDNTCGIKYSFERSLMNSDKFILYLKEA